MRERRSTASQEHQPQLHETETRLKLLKNLVCRVNSGLSVEHIVTASLDEAHKSFPDLMLSFVQIPTEGTIEVMYTQNPRLVSATGLFPTPLISKISELLVHNQILMEEDVSKSALFAPWLDKNSLGALPSGSRSVLLVPVAETNYGMAALAFSSCEPHKWTRFETSTLNDMAEFLAVVLREERIGEERRKMESHLLNSQKMEALGRLVGGIAHDFNNLMTAVLIYAALLEQSMPPEDAKLAHVEEIRLAGERGAGLVSQMLALARQQVLEPRVVSMNDVLKPMDDLLQRLIGEDVILEMHLGAELMNCRLDPAQMQQVILNVALNARDAMPGGGQLHISTTNEEISQTAARGEITAGKYVCVGVSDTGVGMDAETQSRIFEPFFTSRETGKGTGLGLAMVYGVVKQHGGFILVESEVGKGSKFRIYLPATTEAAEGMAASASGSVSPETAAGETLLLVEDNNSVRRSLLAALRHSGFRVLEASGGAEALRIIDQPGQRIDLMITDLVMPGMNGRQLMEHARELRAEMPVLFISGYTDDPRTRELIAEHVEFLQKPFSPATLVRRVRTILDGAIVTSVSSPKVPMFRKKTNAHKRNLIQ